MDRIKYVCSRCGSDDVLFDAYGIWNYEKQEMELLETYDKGHFCNTCDGECSIKQVVIHARLSEQIRPDSECSRWIWDAIRKLESTSEVHRRALEELRVLFTDGCSTISDKEATHIIALIDRALAEGGS